MAIALDLATILGLAMTLIGAALAANAVIVTPDEAIRTAGQSGVSAYGYVEPNRAEFLRQPPVRNLLAQSLAAKRGLSLIAAGTAIQILAVVGQMVLRCA